MDEFTAHVTGRDWALQGLTWDTADRWLAQMGYTRSSSSYRKVRRAYVEQMQREPNTFAARIAELEADGLTRSDAQAVAEAEQFYNGV